MDRIVLLCYIDLQNLIKSKETMKNACTNVFVIFVIPTNYSVFIVGDLSVPDVV